jgi:hypothetical protein
MYCNTIHFAVFFRGGNLNIYIFPSAHHAYNYVCICTHTCAFIRINFDLWATTSSSMLSSIPIQANIRRRWFFTPIHWPLFYKYERASCCGVKMSYCGVLAYRWNISLSSSSSNNRVHILYIRQPRDSGYFFYHLRYFLNTIFLLVNRNN